MNKTQSNYYSNTKYFEVVLSNTKLLFSRPVSRLEDVNRKSAQKIGHQSNRSVGFARSGNLNLQEVNLLC